MPRFLTIPAAICALLAALGAPAPAADKPGDPTDATVPRQVVEKAIQKVLAILSDEKLADPAKAEERHGKIRSVLLEVVDMDIVSTLTLANYRTKFSVAQLRQFKEEFSTLLFQTYITHLEEYKGETVSTQKAVRLSKSRALIMTKVKEADKEMPVDFAMILRGKDWVLYDVRVEGVSMVGNYREQFRDILSKGSVDRFLERLKEIKPDKGK